LEWFKIKVHNNFLSEINFENEKSTTEFINIIRSEYFKKRYRAFLYIIAVCIIYPIYLLFSYQINTDNKSYFLDLQQINLIDQVITWIFFCIILYLIFQFFKLAHQNFSPTFVNFIKMELNNLGFEIQRGYKTGLYFFIFNTIFIIIFILIKIGVSYSYNYIIDILIFGVILLDIFLSIAFPIIWGILHDKFMVKLKKKYYIQFDFRYKCIKSKKFESPNIAIFMTSNRLCSKLNRVGIKLYKNISETRWLPKKSKFFSFLFNFSPFLYFHEYSTPLNFQKQFLNIVLALREWDISS